MIFRSPPAEAVGSPEGVPFRSASGSGPKSFSASVLPFPEEPLRWCQSLTVEVWPESSLVPAVSRRPVGSSPTDPVGTEVPPGTELTLRLTRFLNEPTEAVTPRGVTGVR